MESMQQMPTEMSDKKDNYAFQVICSLCHKVIFFSGDNGEVFEAICDRCSGLY